MMVGKRFLIGGALLSGLLFSSVSAADYPERPITLVVGYTPGGGADTVARIVTEHMSRTLGQPFVIQNKPGAGTTLAAGQVARAKPDGYTLYVGSAILFGVDKVLYNSIDYGPDNFTAVTQWTTAPMILSVNSESAIQTVDDLVEHAKKRPSGLFVSSSGTGGSPHLATLEFEEKMGVKFTHVPYKGGAQAAQAVVSGEVQLTFGTPPSVIPLIQAGRLRGLAVTSEERSSLMPEMPTISELSIPGYSQSFWLGLLAPADTDEKVVHALYQASVLALKDPEVRRKLALQGNDVKWSESPTEFGNWAEQNGRYLAELAQRANLKSH